MNLLFVEGGSRCWADTEGNIYVASNFDRAVQERYVPGGGYAISIVEATKDELKGLKNL
ncbi:MAG: hypothetical protein IJP89_06705 [Synergistaceae bacterium]|nr:hypothetical protein [Synergistaceae bacterium]